jgi:hypothetical protein
VYAAEFGLDPEHVNPSATWWYRWSTWRQAQNAREAVRHSKASTDWVKDLSPEERQALVWANADMDT